MSADAADLSREELVRGLEDTRCLTLQDKDLTRLEELLHPDFVYVHASGRTEDKTDYLGSIADPATTYGHFAHHEMDLTMLGPCALMGGVLSHSKTAGDHTRTLLFRFTAAWAARGDGDWRLLRWHNTKIVPISQERRDELL